jgi:hypothetical protein
MKRGDLRCSGWVSSSSSTSATRSVSVMILENKMLLLRKVVFKDIIHLIFVMENINHEIESHLISL